MTKQKEVDATGKYKVSIPYRRYSFHTTDYIQTHDVSKDIVVAKPIK